MSIARQNNNHDHRAVEWRGDECAGLGLNNLIDKNPCLFLLNRTPAFSESCYSGLGNKLVHLSWLPFIQFSLLEKERTADGDLGGRLKRIRNNVHTLRDQALAYAPGSTSRRYGFCPYPYWDVQFLYSQWKVTFDHLVSAC